MPKPLRPATDTALDAMLAEAWPQPTRQTLASDPEDDEDEDDDEEDDEDERRRRGAR